MGALNTAGSRHHTCLLFFGRERPRETDQLVSIWEREREREEREEREREREGGKEGERETGWFKRERDMNLGGAITNIAYTLVDLFRPWPWSCDRNLGAIAPTAFSNWPPGGAITITAYRSVQALTLIMWQKFGVNCSNCIFKLTTRGRYHYNCIQLSVQALTLIMWQKFGGDCSNCIFKLTTRGRYHYNCLQICSGPDSDHVTEIWGRLLQLHFQTDHQGALSL